MYEKIKISIRYHDPLKFIKNLNNLSLSNSVI